MASVWTRYIRRDTPLPGDFEVSIQAAVLVSQGRAQVSITRLQRAGGRQARFRPLWSGWLDEVPEDHGEAFDALLEAVETARRGLDLEGLG